MIAENSEYLLQNYKRFPLTIEKGEGVYVFDTDEKKYLDFAAGVAVNSLGYAHPAIEQAIYEQAGKILHTSNLFYNTQAPDLAKKLSDLTLKNKAQVFFANSGAEACELAIKAMRRFAALNKNIQNPRIITFEGSFHGRTIATISAANNQNYTNGFSPLLDGFDTAKFGDIASVESLITKETAGILVEPLQGEGGINFQGFEFLEQLSQLCKKHDILLSFDEVQTGVGRLGEFFAYQNADIHPDIICFAKGIAGGLPMGGCILQKQVADVMTLGTHGSTFGANPLVCAVAHKVVDIISQREFLDHVKETSTYFIKELHNLQSQYKNVISKVLGYGLLLGIQLEPKYNNFETADTLIKNGLIAITASQNVLRFLPPLIIEKEHVDEAITKMNDVFKTLS